jgi:hypothetical protein
VRILLPGKILHERGGKIMAQKDAYEIEESEAGLTRFWG